MSVWGGEENDPPYYGRLFVSLLNEDPENSDAFTDGEEIIQAIQLLKDKCVVTILPEYIGPLPITEEINLAGTSNQSVTNLSVPELQAKVTAELNKEYKTDRQFNKIIKESDI